MAPPSLDIPGTSHEDAAPVRGTTGRTIVHAVSDNIAYTDDHILSKYVYENAHVSKIHGKLVVTPTKTQYEFKTNTRVPKVGYMSPMFVRANVVSCSWVGAVITEVR
jgi:myo-inositol-1-phosphate synthase